MPGRNPELPEGTDHIINGAAEMSSGTGVGGYGDAGFVASSASGRDTGGLSTGGFSTAGAGGGTASLGGTGTGATGDIKSQVRNSAQGLKGQATDKVRSYAVDGKNRATSALDELANVVQDAATSLDEKLGAQYGQYARQAADTVSGLANTLRDKDVDELFDDARNVVRKSPGVAIGVAAAVGFALVRLVKVGLPQEGAEVDFTPEPGRDVQFISDDIAASSGAGAASGAGV